MSLNPVHFEHIRNKDGFYISHTVVAASTATNYGIIFTAIHPCELLSAVETHTAAGTDSSSVSLQLERLSGTDALDAGDEMLVTAWNLKNTANTTVVYEQNELQNRQLITGDRIALKDAGTLTAVAGVSVTLYFKRLGKGDYR